MKKFVSVLIVDVFSQNIWAINVTVIILHVISVFPSPTVWALEDENQISAKFIIPGL